MLPEWIWPLLGASGIGTVAYAAKRWIARSLEDRKQRRLNERTVDSVVGKAEIDRLAEREERVFAVSQQHIDNLLASVQRLSEAVRKRDERIEELRGLNEAARELAFKCALEKTKLVARLEAAEAQIAKLTSH